MRFLKDAIKHYRPVSDPAKEKERTALREKLDTAATINALRTGESRKAARRRSVRANGRAV
jgi:hypothetical protein